MFLGNNFRGTNLTIPVHRGIISREDENKHEKSRKTWLLPVIILLAGLLAVIYLTPARTEKDEPPASVHQMEPEYGTEAMSG